jgi:CubicO group peptidase (beta-lactamase class C family)
MHNIEAIAHKAIQEGVFPCCAIGILRSNEKKVYSFGNFTYESESQSITNDSLFDLASITKSIPTASLALTFAQEGIFKVTDPVKKFIPEMHNDFGTTIEDLLKYRVQGSRMSTLGFPTFEQIRTHVLENGFSAAPGESNYTNLPAYVLGVILERATGLSLAALGNKYFFEPLSMNNTTFFPARSVCVPTEIQNGSVVQGIVHDESARVFAQARRAVGHAGLFSTASDLITFAEALVANKFPAVLSGAIQGFGWSQKDEVWMGTKVSESVFGKTGFTGTSIIVDPERHAALVILSNRTYPTRPLEATSVGSAINGFRRNIAEMVFA